jgi:hypothetical protein
MNNQIGIYGIKKGQSGSAYEILLDTESPIDSCKLTNSSEIRRF